MATALVALGSNLGDRRENLDRAVQALSDAPNVKAVAVSSYHHTAAVGGPQGQPEFLNAAVRLQTTLDPAALLSELQAIEQRLGRVRHEHWGPRTVDLDLLLYDELRLETPRLTVPHPRMAFRRFVLEPAAEVGGDLVHPPTGWTVARLLAHLNTAKPYVVVLAAGLGPFCETLAEALPARFLAFDWARYERSDADEQAALVRDYALSLSAVNWPVDGGLVLGDCALELLHERFAERSEVIAAIHAAAKPKLTIVCSGPDPATPSAEFDSVAALRSGYGPTLFVKEASVAAALAEAIAAVRAMD